MKATHKGTCQICGCTQMLPSGALAKHGYTIKWGFFSGTCSGSHYLPFEQSTDHIQGAIDAVSAQIERVKAEIAGYEDLSNLANDGSSVWQNVYTNDDYQWVKVRLHDFVTDSISYAPFILSHCSFTTIDPVYNWRTRKGEGLTEKVEAYDEKWKMHTLPEWARFMNRKYAATLAKANQQRAGWISWQHERVKNWEPKPLIVR